jgi:hypothetical protein
MISLLTCSVRGSRDRDPRSINPHCPVRFYQTRAAHHPPAAGSSDVIPIPVSRPVDRGSRSRYEELDASSGADGRKFPSGTGEAGAVKQKSM